MAWVENVVPFFAPNREDTSAMARTAINQLQDQIEAVLRRDPRAMNSATILGYRFADAVDRRSADGDEFRDAIRAQWGDKGVIDLTLALRMGRMFPMVKAGLGYAKECRRVSVDGRNVDVIRQAA